MVEKSSIAVTPNGEIKAREELREVIQGFATAEGTSRFRDRHIPSLGETAYKTLGTTEFCCSAAGFGTYRVDVRVATHRAALAMAIRKGINIIDTSSNYADGNSERLVGQVLQGLLEHGVCKREELIIVSKGGYLQGENYSRAKQMDEASDADRSAGSELAELVRYGNDLWHSIHPKFLEDQITRSLDRMQIQTIDFYLLHNPEYYIQWAIRDGIDEQDARDEYERRIEQAFEYLESEVTKGRIQYYGISSNTFPKPEESIDRTSVERSLQSAEAVAQKLGIEKHHFAMIQLPLNIFEPYATTEMNHSKGTMSAITFAEHNNLSVLVNRPLNSIIGRMLKRLADFPEREHPPEEDINDLVHDLKLQETEFKSALLKDVSMNPQAYDAVKKLLSLGDWLEGKWSQFSSYEEWKDTATTVIAPRIQYAMDFIRPVAQKEEAIYKAIIQYAESSDEIMEHISNFYSTQAAKRAETIHQAIDEMIGPDYKDLSLSQKAVLLARSLSGVSSVLVGMRSEEYVEDVVFGLQAKPIPHVDEEWERFAAVL